MDDLLTKIINFIFPHQNILEQGEEIFWNHHWDGMIEYYKKNKEIFEIKNKWDFYCNKELHNHYKGLVGGFKNLRCIECGSGGGYESSLMALDLADVTILDYSQKALEYARIVATRLNTIDKIKFFRKDIKELEDEAIYDIAWNCGVIEHYQDNEIIAMIKKMSFSVKKKGLVIVTIPNLLSPQSIYWILKTGKGSERYLSHKKMKILMEKTGLVDIRIEPLNYWLPSFLPAKWAYKTRNFRMTKIIKNLPWLFSAIGTVK